ncbi:MAG: hypothetical protein E7066_05345 [Lentimicrobiaceae bacterium]|nr:hypothetical protein [Lentimicrobiaceae bacterium]
MIITITFNELKEIISNKTNDKVNLDLHYVNYNTIKVSYKPVAFLPAVNVNVQIREVGNSKIVLSYNANNAIDMIIKGPAAFLDSNIPKEIIELDTTDQIVTLYPTKVEQLQKPLEMIELQQLYFDDDKVCVEVKMP